jgi:two-component system phosphate regulon sensor histidine kinase PhoR
MKSDFINNMTHEFKTPIATISLACEVLQDKDVQKSENSRERYIKMITEENTRLGMLVENVLRTSLFEQGQMKMKVQTISLNDVVQSVVRSFDLQVKNRRAVVLEDYLAKNDHLECDALHITNLIFNLFDNALKYSFEMPEIQIIKGRFGPYIKCGDDNYKIPKGTEADQLTLDEVLAIFAQTTPSGKKKSTKSAAKKSPVKKAAPKKAAPKKLAVKKAAKKK